MASSRMLFASLLVVALATGTLAQSVVVAASNEPAACDGLWMSNSNTSYVVSVYTAPGVCMVQGVTDTEIPYTFYGVMVQRPGNPYIWDTFVNDGNYTAVFTPGNDDVLPLHQYGDDSGTANFTWYRQAANYHPSPNHLYYGATEEAANKPTLTGWWEAQPNPDNVEAIMVCMEPLTANMAYMCSFTTTVVPGGDPEEVHTIQVSAIQQSSNRTRWNGYTSEGFMLAQLEGETLYLWAGGIDDGDAYETANASLVMVRTPAPLVTGAPSPVGLFRETEEDLWLVVACNSPSNAPGASLCVSAGRNVTSGLPAAFSAKQKYSPEGTFSTYWSDNDVYNGTFTSVMGDMQLFFDTSSPEPQWTFDRVEILQDVEGTWYEPASNSTMLCTTSTKYATCQGGNATNTFENTGVNLGYGMWSNLGDTDEGEDSGMVKVAADGFTLHVLPNGPTWIRN